MRREWWLVPVLHDGREMEGLWVKAADSNAAAVAAYDAFAQHGYTVEDGYALGDPLSALDLFLGASLPHPVEIKPRRKGPAA